MGGVRMLLEINRWSWNAPLAIGDAELAMLAIAAGHLWGTNWSVRDLRLSLRLPAESGHDVSQTVADPAHEREQDHAPFRRVSVSWRSTG